MPTTRAALLILCVAVALSAACGAERTPTPAGRVVEKASATTRDAGVDPYATENACLSCHQGIELIRCCSSEMMTQILQVAEQSGTNNRCVVCHGGNAEVRADLGLDRASEAYRALADAAHAGTPPWFETNPGPKDFYPDPGSPWINHNSCGPCHEWEVKTQWQSLMMTEAGKIQGTQWGFGAPQGYDHVWANYDVETLPDDEQVGTPAYHAYMKELAAKEPQVFVDAMHQVPAAPTSSDEVAADPTLAAFTYIRGECQRCHLAVGGKQRHGDYRGMGCSACHIPYGNAGRYEGGDAALKDAPAGRPLVHSIQSGIGAPVSTGDVSWTGIPVETCTTCHNRGRRIGVSYQGLMETPYASPWTPEGGKQQALHGKHYLHLHADLHKDKGFLCQDCHTTLDAHSSGRLTGAISGAVEIECSDCHGTPFAFPWDLPLGTMDEYETRSKEGPPRGTASQLPPFMAKGDYPDVEDGYLLTARGNPLGNAVRTGDTVHIHLASGAVHELLPLKKMADENLLSLEGEVAMVRVGAHMERMECYACHATWAPQCYGCHIKIDYTEADAHLDWVAVGHAHGSDGMTPENDASSEGLRIPGKIVESRSFLRWEDPPLGQNGEGRVAPVIPGCQTTVTVIGENGETILENHIFRLHGLENGGEEGQRGIDMSPLHPHTVQKEARSCESCHASPKALGYGIGGGDYFADPSVDHVVDLETADGRVIPGATVPQMKGVKNLGGDWSRFVTEDGEQIQTVGHHFKLSGPLSQEEREHMWREGICIACHEEIPDASVAINLLHHTADALGVLPRTNAAHSDLVQKSTLLAAWAQVLGGAVGGITALLAVLWLWRRRRRKRASEAA